MGTSFLGIASRGETMIKTKVKYLLGVIRAERFGIHTGKNVYIGKYCSLKGKHHITLENFVTIRSYVQIWSGGDGKNRQGLRNW